MTQVPSAMTALRRFLLCSGALGLLALPACNEKTADAGTTPRQDRRAVEIATAQLRTDPALGRNVVLQEVQAYAQAEENLSAVCGQVSVDGAQGRFVPFVATVNFASSGKPEVTPFLATSSIEATRVYVETQSRCRDMGGPRQTARLSAPPLLPAIPANLPYLRQASFPAATAQAAETPSGTEAGAVAKASRTTSAGPAEGSVVTRQAANLRSSPNGGSVTRVVSGGQSLQVYGTAAGGWYQVGDASGPTGWMHGSMVNRAP